MYVAAHAVGERVADVRVQAGTSRRSSPRRWIGRLRPPVRQFGSCTVGWLHSRWKQRASPDHLPPPQVDHLRPAAWYRRRPIRRSTPVALLLGDGAEVRRHVVHVVGAVVPDDVDELVDVDLVVHRVGRIGRQFRRPTSVRAFQYANFLAQRYSRRNEIARDGGARAPHLAAVRPRHDRIHRSAFPRVQKSGVRDARRSTVSRHDASRSLPSPSGAAQRSVAPASA